MNWQNWLKISTKPNYYAFCAANISNFENIILGMTLYMIEMIYNLNNVDTLKKTRQMKIKYELLKRRIFLLVVKMIVNVAVLITLKT
jgi:hypothetical protein